MNKYGTRFPHHYFLPLGISHYFTIPPVLSDVVLTPVKNMSPLGCLPYGSPLMSIVLRYRNGQSSAIKHGTRFPHHSYLTVGTWQCLSTPPELSYDALTTVQHYFMLSLATFIVNIPKSGFSVI